MSKYSELFRAVARSGDKDLSSAEDGEQEVAETEDPLSGEPVGPGPVGLVHS